MTESQSDKSRQLAKRFVAWVGDEGSARFANLTEDQRNTLAISKALLALSSCPPVDRNAGLEDAAQWHVDLAEKWQAENTVMAQWHRNAAMGLRALKAIDAEPECAPNTAAEVKAALDELATREGPYAAPSEGPTPRFDDIVNGIVGLPHLNVIEALSDFARQLERECRILTDAANISLKRADDLQRELAEANEEIESLKINYVGEHRDGSLASRSASAPIEAVVAEAEKMARLINDCAPFLKEGETPAECIARNRADADGVLGEFARERIRAEKAEASLSARRETT